MRYRIETWENNHEIHYSDPLTMEQVEANLRRSPEVRFAVLQDLGRDHVDTYIDFSQRTFTVRILDN